MQKFDFKPYGRIGVLYGGVSAEREVSLSSGRAIIDACHTLGIDVVDVEINDDVIDCIKKANIDTAFIALHGGIGEDGRLQSLLDFMGIRYTGSGVQSSVVAMNKLMSKQMWLGMGLPTPKFSIIDQSIDSHELLASLGGSAIIKPAHEGSSIGMTIVKNSDELNAAYQTALKFDSCVFAEQLLPGAEYTVAVLNGEVLPPIKLETDHVFYDYDAKYLADDTRYLCPCGLSKEKEDELKALSLWAFNSLQCQGWGRVDVMVDEAGEFSVLEVNTVPGMTSHSLVPMAAKAAGYSFEALISTIIQSIEIK
ncbi:MAG: D-alanine--D-alanine ligase [Cellvibrionaceae bacterium]